MLLLRGPQTVGELRIRTERMAKFDSLDEIEHQLEFLGSREEPLAHNVGRRPGQKEERWATPLVAAPVVVAEQDRGSSPTGAPAPPNDVADDLRSELAELRAEVADLRHEIQELRDSLGG